MDKILLAEDYALRDTLKKLSDRFEAEKQALQSCSEDDVEGYFLECVNLERQIKGILNSL